MLIKNKINTNLRLTFHLRTTIQLVRLQITGSTDPPVATRWHGSLDI